MASRLLLNFLFCVVALLPGTTSAGPITRSLTVEVFQLFDDAGTNGASLGPAGNNYFAAEVNKIWAQAGISVSFHYVTGINSTHFSNIDDGIMGRGFADLTAFAQTFYGGHGISSTTVDMFMVHTVAGAYGEAWLGAGGMVIAMDTVMAYNGGLGRIDTIAHELGHNLGLVAPTDPDFSGYHSTNPNQLMASGLIRNVPSTIADIAPNGLNRDQISQYQIDLARGSSLLHDVAVPEPGSFLLLAFGVGGLGIVVRFRRREVS